MPDRETLEVAQNLVQFGLISPGRLSRELLSHGQPQGRPPPADPFPRPYYANHSSSIVVSRTPSRKLTTLTRRPRQVSTPLRAHMTGMLDIERPAVFNRGERTFAGCRCVICEEPLEHTLRGERFLQLTCSHVSHEACFYDFIRHADSQHCPECSAPLGLDPGRGGNVLNLEKLSQIIRSYQTPPQYHQQYPYQYSQPPDPSPSAFAHPPKSWHEHAHTITRDTSNGSTRTVTNSPTVTTKRRHAVESSIDTTVPTTTTRFSLPRNPIASPVLNLRSEYPTLTRSKQPQSLTCLITVEVPDTNIRPNFSEQQTSKNAASAVPEPVHISRPPTPPKDIEEDELDSSEEMDGIALDLQSRVDNWHGLDFSKFGPLRLHHRLQVGKDAHSWQELECYLFSEMLICVKEKKVTEHAAWDSDEQVPQRKKATLKGSIMIKKHLESVETSPDDDNRLSLNLSVPELPLFHLQFPNDYQLQMWEQALSKVLAPQINGKTNGYDHDHSPGDDDEDRKETAGRTISSVASSYGANKSVVAMPPDYNDFAEHVNERMSISLHAPIDLVLVVPVAASMSGIKMDLMRDSLRFLIQNLGPRDRMALVAFGASTGVSRVVGLTTKTWPGWPTVLETLHATGQKTSAGDLVQGANVAMDILMQRKTINPVSSLFVVSDSSIAENESIDFVVQRAEAAKVSAYTFGLGLAHRPDVMIELSDKTEASYIYVKDWMTLRECLAGCLGSLQTISHQNLRLKLRLPEDSPVKFAKISGTLQITKRAGGRDAECLLGDLRYGDKRDILVQLTIAPEIAAAEVDPSPQDAWDSMVSNLEALGGPVDYDGARAPSVEEVPVLQADLLYGDILHHGATTQSPRPSLLAITLLAPATKYKPPRPQSLPIPPHASIVQRRMELLTSDMLTRALALAAKAQNDRAHHLLRETRSILKGLGKGGLPPLPSRNGMKPPPTPPPNATSSPTISEAPEKSPTSAVPPSPHPLNLSGAVGVDLDVMSALDAELEAALEWINHPNVFNRDARKAVLQAIGAINSQRAYTYRSSLESLWANRISGVRDMAAKSREWRKEEDVTVAK